MVPIIDMKKSSSFLRAINVLPCGLVKIISIVFNPDTSFNYRWKTVYGKHLVREKKNSSFNIGKIWLNF